VIPQTVHKKCNGKKQKLDRFSRDLKKIDGLNKYCQDCLYDLGGKKKSKIGLKEYNTITEAANNSCAICRKLGKLETPAFPYTVMTNADGTFVTGKKQQRYHMGHDHGINDCLAATREPLCHGCNCGEGNDLTGLPQVVEMNLKYIDVNITEMVMIKMMTMMKTMTMMVFLLMNVFRWLQGQTRGTMPNYKGTRKNTRQHQN